MPEKKELSYFQTIVKGLFGVLFIFVLVFLLAGRLDYWPGWVFCGVMVVIITIQLVLFKDKADLAQERMKPGPGIKGWDKVIWALFGPAMFAIFIVAVLDTGRFGWSRELPVYFYLISYAVFLLSIYIFTWAMWVNKWFSSVVRIQKDRDQQVVQTGPYKIIRHPGYTGGILMALTMGLIFGSLWSIIPAFLSIILLIIRTQLEDSTLQKELPGYAEYAQKTKYRLVPGVW